MFVDIYDTDRKYGVVYADPPWRYDNRASHGAAEKHYQTLSLQDLCALPVKDLLLPDAILFLWVTWPQLTSGLYVMPSWDFRYKTLGFIWIKQTKNGRPIFGLGNYTRANSEPCLIGVKGRPAIEDRSISQIVLAERRKHSQKPDEVRDLISRLCGDVPKLELFGRDHHPRWDVYGDDPLL